MDLKEAKRLFGGPAPPGSSLIFTEREKERQKEGRKRGREKGCSEWKRNRGGRQDAGGEIESRDKREPCYWATPAPMDSQQDSKPHSASKGEPGKKIFFFFSLLFTKTYLIYFWPSQQPLAPPPEPCSMTQTRVTLPSLLFFSLV